MNQHFKLLSFTLLLSFTSIGQEIVSKERQEVRPFKSQSLTYSPELPKEGSYTIIFNEKSEYLTEAQLMEMNKHRRYDESVEWKVNPGLVVLLKPFEK